APPTAAASSARSPPRSPPVRAGGRGRWQEAVKASLWSSALESRIRNGFGCPCFLLLPPAPASCFLLPGQLERVEELLPVLARRGGRLRADVEHLVEARCDPVDARGERGLLLRGGLAGELLAGVAVHVDRLLARHLPADVLDGPVARLVEQVFGVGG